MSAGGKSGHSERYLLNLGIVPLGQ